MLLFEVQSLTAHETKPIIETFEGVHNNREGYKAAVSCARYYVDNGLTAAVIAHDKSDYANSAFTCFYATPSKRKYANAHKDALDFFICDWRKGY